MKLKRKVLLALLICVKEFELIKPNRTQSNTIKISTTHPKYQKMSKESVLVIAVNL